MFLSLWSYVIVYLSPQSAMRQTQIRGIVIGSLVLGTRFCHGRVSTSSAYVGPQPKPPPAARTSFLLFRITICLAPHRPPDAIEFTDFGQRKERWNHLAMSRKLFPHYLRHGLSRVRCIS
jgi:hypothetical protein